VSIFACYFFALPQEGWYENRPHSFLVYAPARTCVVYGPADHVDPLKVGYIRRGDGTKSSTLSLATYSVANTMHLASVLGSKGPITLQYYGGRYIVHFTVLCSIHSQSDSWGT